MNARKLAVGTRVQKDMGCRLVGTVVWPIALAQCTDGTYRAPMSHEHVVWVRWDDGSIGWTHRAFIVPERKAAAWT